jgi:ribonuclease T2
VWPAISFATLAAAFASLVVAFTDEGVVRAGDDFDFYVLALSWSPSFCEREADADDAPQCGGGTPYGFVVHGLWPQHERGYPEFCQTAETGAPDARELAALSDIMPSEGLARYQWLKHGSCSGLSRDAYFKALRQAFERIRIPQAYRQVRQTLRVGPDGIEQEFVRANGEGMVRSGIAVTCQGRHLAEVRICMTKDFAFRPCPEVDQKGCRRTSIVMPPARG